MVHIYYKTNCFQFRKIRKQLKRIWVSHGYRSVGDSFFCNDAFSLIVNRYSLSVGLTGEEMSDDMFKDYMEQLDELLRTIFSEKVKGFVGAYSPNESQELIDEINSIENIIKTSRFVSCSYSADQVQELYIFIKEMERTPENKKQLDAVEDILRELAINC